MRTTRDLIIETASTLFENQGFHATGLNQIVKESGAPKGSLYHYFPGGKDEIAEAVIEYASGVVAERITAGVVVTDDPAEAIRSFVRQVAEHVEASGYARGGPLTTIAMETATTNERLNRACRAAYSRVQAAFEAKLRQAGVPEIQAQHLAMCITETVEGSIILCRTYHSGDPLRLAADQLRQLIAASLSQPISPRQRNDGTRSKP